ncbi:MAG: Wzy polymerase domain-containing protein [Rubrivivax sp.]
MQLALALAMCAWFARRAGLRLRPAHVVGLLLLGGVLQATWSPLDDALARRVDRPLEEKLSAGARPAIWRDMLAAVAREPLAGHGWLQIGAAQQSIALDRPPVPVLFEHVDRAHNLVLDLLLWAGIPVGLAIVVLAALALAGQLRRITDARAVWLMTVPLGLFAHAMLEFPLEFAYFLIPLGISLGMVHAMSHSNALAVRLPRWALPAGGAAMAALLALVANDYIQAEENFRQLRMETARIGTTRVVAEVPHLRVLNQLESFLWLVRTEPRAGLSAAELERMHKTSQRYGMAPALYRYAMALGLNGRPEEAARTLALLCHVHSRKRCQEAREAWPAMQQRHEALRAVPAP